jgi:hypothetical protein
MDLFTLHITDAWSGKPLAGLEAHLRCSSHQTTSGETFRAVSQANGKITHWSFSGSNPWPSLTKFVKKLQDDVSEWQIAINTTKHFGPNSWPLTPVTFKLNKNIPLSAILTIAQSNFLLFERQDSNVSGLLHILKFAVKRDCRLLYPSGPFPGNTRLETPRPHSPAR